MVTLPFVNAGLFCAGWCAVERQATMHRRGYQGVVYRWDSLRRRPSPVFWERIQKIQASDLPSPYRCYIQD